MTRGGRTAEGRRAAAVRAATSLLAAGFGLVLLRLPLPGLPPTLDAAFQDGQLPAAGLAAGMVYAFLVAQVLVEVVAAAVPAFRAEREAPNRRRLALWAIAGAALLCGLDLASADAPADMVLARVVAVAAALSVARWGAQRGLFHPLQVWVLWSLLTPVGLELTGQLDHGLPTRLALGPDPYPTLAYFVLTLVVQSTPLDLKRRGTHFVPLPLSSLLPVLLALALPAVPGIGGAFESPWAQASVAVILALAVARWGWPSGLHNAPEVFTTARTLTALFIGGMAFIEAARPPDDPYSPLAAVVLAAFVGDLVAEVRFRLRHPNAVCIARWSRVGRLPELYEALDRARIPFTVRHRRQRSLWHVAAPHLEMEVLVAAERAPEAERRLDLLRG
jgi:hypothetical protein